MSENVNKPEKKERPLKEMTTGLALLGFLAPICVLIVLIIEFSNWFLLIPFRASSPYFPRIISIP